MNFDALQKNEHHIKEELNIKTLTFVNDESEIARYELKIDFKKLGPKFGKDLPQIQKALAELPAKDVVKRLRAQLPVELKLNGREVALNFDEVTVEIKSREDFVVLESDGMLLGLNTHLTDELLAEGMARDLVRHIQELRKEANFEMNDRISLYFQGSEKIKNVFVQHADYIKAETLSVEISELFSDAVFSKDIKFSGESVRLGVKK
ncbi:MAG: DUF5915 domain-containing protein [bacterium]|nr:DUF5915 domain-containing protein [bacterium]